MALPTFLQSAPNAKFRSRVIARLNARVQPLDRTGYFEEPLNARLKDGALGEVTGGGTQLSGDAGGIAHCDVECLLRDLEKDTLKALIGALEDCGAPKGSRLVIEGRPDIAFGTLEGLGLFLDGTGLTDEIYASHDVNDLITELDTALGRDGAFMGYWEGAAETALYFYGASFQQMGQIIAPILRDIPLCQNARQEQIA